MYPDRLFGHDIDTLTINDVTTKVDFFDTIRLDKRDRTYYRDVFETYYTYIPAGVWINRYILLNESNSFFIILDAILEYEKHVELKWQDPSDITDYKPHPAEWKGTIVIRKENSPPLHRWDGIEIIKTTTSNKNAYKDTPYKDEDIQLGRTYYYGFFPYYKAREEDGHNINFFRYTKVIRVDTGVVANGPIINSITADGTSVTINYKIPADAKGYDTIKLYGKKNKNPSCSNTDDIIEDIDNEEHNIIVSVPEGNCVYNFCIQSVNADGLTLSSNVEGCQIGAVAYGFVEHMDITNPTQRIEYIGANADYSPVVIDLAGNHTANFNDWTSFFVLTENKPYMVGTNGQADYELKETDYTRRNDTGDSSDVANSSYNGGAFAWLPKIYTYQYIDGNDRYVYYSKTKIDENYEAVGFKVDENTELEGIWLPMFYGAEIAQSGTTKILSLALNKPNHDRNVPTQKTYIDNFSSRARFFGGPIVNVIADLLTMLGKNSDIQAVFGMGNSQSGDGTNYMKDNAVVGGGAFYGSSDGRSLNKVFHSLVPITQNQSQRDPYTLGVGGTIKVSPYYNYDLTGSSYQATGVSYGNISSWVYPHKHIIVPHYGVVPVSPYSGSTTGGDCDAFAISGSGTKVGMRFCSCDAGKIGGPRCIDLRHDQSVTYWTTGAAVMLLPPTGYKPN